MSHPYERYLSLAGIDTSGLSDDELYALARKILEAGIHGISFSPYVEGQGPGTELGAAQIRERLSVLEPYVRWIRTFSCTDGNELIPGIAAERGLKTMVGVWLDGNLEQNEAEIANAIEIARAGHAGVLAVGNEVLLRDELTADQLIEYMRRVKEAAPGVPVGYVDAYFKFVDYPQVTAACDVVLANCYPYWEGCPAEYALVYMKDMYRRASQVAGPGKKVIITETGWPSGGPVTRGNIASLRHAAKYFVDTYQWAEEDGVEIFWFSSFDEGWKAGSEGDVGAYWGIWDKDGKLKYV
ncbi:MAG: glycosyl hydrolase [Gemmatimonadetes bacterium]|nr:glycosyl hydrolase [Gemmatimonadota bacterium]